MRARPVDPVLTHAYPPHEGRHGTLRHTNSGATRGALINGVQRFLGVP